MYTHRSIVFHIGGGSLSTDSPFKLFLNFRNNLYLLYKNLPKKKLFPVLTQRMFLDMFSALVYLLKGSPKKSAAVCKAHFAFLKNKRKFKEKRKALPGKNKLPIQMVKKSMLFDFFIRKKTYFRQLLHN
jgi:GT2 family glycosyltransferase